MAAEPAGTVLNVNVPNRALPEVAGVCHATLARFGTVRVALREGESEAPVLEIRGDGEQSAGEGTDTAMLAAGYVTVTSLSGVRADPHADAVLAMTQAAAYPWAGAAASHDRARHRRRGGPSPPRRRNKGADVQT